MSIKELLINSIIYFRIIEFTLYLFTLEQTYLHSQNIVKEYNYCKFKIFNLNYYMRFIHNIIFDKTVYYPFKLFLLFFRYFICL